jgi:hypothetical protein
MFRFGVFFFRPYLLVKGKLLVVTLILGMHPNTAMEIPRLDEPDVLGPPFWRPGFVPGIEFKMAHQLRHGF